MSITDAQNQLAITPGTPGGARAGNNPNLWGLPPLAETVPSNPFDGGIAASLSRASAGARPMVSSSYFFNHNTPDPNDPFNSAAPGTWGGPSNQTLGAAGMQTFDKPSGFFGAPGSAATRAVNATNGLPYPGGAAAPLPEAQGFTDQSNYGWGNFGPQAAAQMDFYNQMGRYSQSQQAPQLARTAIDFSGTGVGGQGGSSYSQGGPGGNPGQMPGMPMYGGAAQPGGAPPGQPPQYSPNFSTSPGGLSADAFRQSQGPQYAPPGAGTAAPGSFGGGAAQPPGNTSFGQAPAPAQTGQPQGAPPQGAPGGGMFSNPTFQMGMQTRGTEGDVQSRLMNPGMYTTPDQQAAAQTRDAQARTMMATSSKDWYANPDQGVQQQGRATQQGVFNATTAPGLYNTQDYGAAMQSRGQQQGLVNRLQGDMAGGQPSLAQLQLKQGTDSNIAAAQALAASSGPQNAALAQRQAMQTAAAQNQSLSGQSAMLRAQEYAQARGELGQATTNLRGQDIQNLGMTYQNTTNQAQLAAQQAQAMRGQDIQNLGMDYQNRGQQASLAASQAASMRGADLQNLGMTYQNTTNQSQMMAQNAQATRAQDLQNQGMSYANAIAQAQLEAQQNQYQGQLQMSQNALNSQNALAYYGMGNQQGAQDMAARQHYMDLMAQKYSADRGYQLQQQQISNQAGQAQQASNDKWLGAALGAGGAILGSVIAPGAGTVAGGVAGQQIARAVS